MATNARRLTRVALWGIAVLSASPAFAQRVLPNSTSLPNPAYQVAPGLGINQAAYNLAVMGRAMQNVPPYAYGAGAVPPLTTGYNLPAYAYTSPLYNTPFYGGLSAGYGGSGGGTASMTSQQSGGGGGTLNNSPYATSPGYGGGGSGTPAYQEPGMYNIPPNYGYPGYYESEAGGALRGTAAVISSQGDLMMQYQKSLLLHEQYHQAQVDTRRRVFEEWLYERANTPTLQDMAEHEARDRLRRVMNPGTVTVPDILSGDALNTILRDIKARPNGARTGPTLSEGFLKQLNVIPEGTAGNLGIFKALKDGRPLSWPLVLQSSASKDEVRRINQRADEVVRQAQNGAVDPGVLNDLSEDVRRLRSKVSSNINDLTPSQYVEATRFLNQLGDGLTALKQPGAADTLNDRWLAQVKTLPELVQRMGEKGLKFAPATPGDEGAYAALRDYLASYLAQQAQGGGSSGQ